MRNYRKAIVILCMELYWVEVIPLSFFIFGKNGKMDVHILFLNFRCQWKSKLTRPATMSKQHWMLQLISRTILLTKSKQTEHVQFEEISRKTRSKRQHCRRNVLYVEKIVRLVSINNVASTLLLVWTGLKGGYTDLVTVPTIPLPCPMRRRSLLWLTA